DSGLLLGFFRRILGLPGRLGSFLFCIRDLGFRPGGAFFRGHGVPPYAIRFRIKVNRATPKLYSPKSAKVCFAASIRSRRTARSVAAKASPAEIRYRRKIRKLKVPTPFVNTAIKSTTRKPAVRTI